MGRDEFAGYHPVVNFAFFCAVIACGVLFLHPAFVGIAFWCPGIRNIDSRQKNSQVDVLLPPPHDGVGRRHQCVGKPSRNKLLVLLGR